MANFRKLLWVSALAAVGAIPVAALAQAWPARAVTIVVPFGAGGPTDLVARVLGPSLEAALKQSVIIDNRPGAGGMIGTGEVSRAKPDGYTMLFQANGVTLAPLFQKSIPYDPADLRPIVGVANSYYLVVTSSAGPAKTLPEFIAYAKSHPKQTNVAMVPYTPPELDMNGLLQKVGIDMTQINYNGIAAILPALMRGDVHLTMTGTSTLLPLVKAGKLTALAYTGPKRSALLPDVPTLREQGVDLLIGYTLGVWVPAKTPADIVERITAGVITAAQSPSVSKIMNDQAFEPADYRAYGQQVQTEQKTYTEIAHRIGLTPR